MNGTLDTSKQALLSSLAAVWCVHEWYIRLYTSKQALLSPLAAVWCVQGWYACTHLSKHSFPLQQQYGGYTEEQWCQLYPSSGGICYFNKLTGVLQYGRPDDFRPFLQVSMHTGDSHAVHVV